MKYFLSVLLIALACQANAQLECYTCLNCDTVTATTLRTTCAHPELPTPPTPAPPSTPGFESLPPLTSSLGPSAPDPPLIPNTTPTNPQNPVPTPSMNPANADEKVTDSGDLEETTGSQGLVRRRRDVSAAGAAHFSCFRIRVPTGVGTTTQVNRGCVQNGGSTDQTCSRAGNYAANVTECRICSGNRCNSSSGLFSSVLLVIASVFVAYKMF